MVDKQGKRRVLRSWKDISSYLKQSIKTCRRWELELGLPIHRLEDTPKARVFAFTDELDRWLENIQKSEEKIVVYKKKLVPQLMLALMAAASITIIIWFNFRQQEKPFSTAVNPSLAVMYFENHTGDENLEYWTRALSVSLIHSLMQCKSVRILSFDRLQTALKELDISHSEGFSSRDLKRIMKKTEVDYIIHGYFIRAGDTMRIDTTIRDSTGKYLFESKTTEGEEDEIFLIVGDEMIPWILSCLGSEEEASSKSTKSILEKVL